MKFKLESKPEGIIVCHLLGVLEKRNVQELATGIEKALANGKARIILNFSAEAADPKSVAEIEKTLKNHQTLARKMGGDIAYVFPPAIAPEVKDASPTLAIAVNQVLKKTEYASFDKSRLISEIRSLSDKVRILELENAILSEKLKDHLRIISDPMTQTELSEGLKFYQALAEQIEKN